MLASFLVQNMLQRRFEKYSKVPLTNGMTGAEVARKMMNDNGIYDVKVECVPGMLTDHYNPATKTVNLSEAVYSGRSVAAAAVAAHECGHVVQHAVAALMWLLLFGVMMVNGFPALLWLGIILFAATTLFSFVTLPVEINASSRAVNWLESAGITNYETKPMAIDALKWAAYTYVIAALSSLATLFYYISVARNRN